MNTTPDFQTLRDQWALKAPTPSKDRLEGQALMDHNANPHNEPYHNKKPRRSEAETVSDLAYAFADNVLHKQYPSLYKDWLHENGYRDKWGAMTYSEMHDRVGRNPSHQNGFSEFERKN